MCLLVIQPKGSTLTRAEMNTYHDANPDGFGAAYGDGQRLHMVKLVGTPKDAWKAYRSTFAGKEALLHWRYATHGAKAANNAHPFLITPTLALAHNGILSTGNDADKAKTDTECFVDLILRPMVQARGELYLFEPAILDALGSLIGRGNKFGLVHASGRTAVVNPEQGTKVGAWWYSNTNFGYSSRYSGSRYSGSRYSRDLSESDLWGRGWKSVGTGSTRAVPDADKGRGTGRGGVKVTPLTATGERAPSRSKLIEPGDFLDATDVTLWHMRDALNRLSVSGVCQWAREYPDAVAACVAENIEAPASVVRGHLADTTRDDSLHAVMVAAVRAGADRLDALYQSAVGDYEGLADLRDAGLLACGDDCLGCFDCLDLDDDDADPVLLDDRGEPVVITRGDS